MPGHLLSLALLFSETSVYSQEKAEVFAVSNCEIGLVAPPAKAVEFEQIVAEQLKAFPANIRGRRLALRTTGAGELYPNEDSVAWQSWIASLRRTELARDFQFLNNAFVMLYSTDDQKRFSFRDLAIHFSILESHGHDPGFQCPHNWDHECWVAKSRRAVALSERYRRIREDVQPLRKLIQRTIIAGRASVKLKFIATLSRDGEWKIYAWRLNPDRERTAGAGNWSHIEVANYIEETEEDEVVGGGLVGMYSFVEAERLATVNLIILQDNRSMTLEGRLHSKSIDMNVLTSKMLEEIRDSAGVSRGVEVQVGGSWIGITKRLPASATGSVGIPLVDLQKLLNELP